MLTHANIMQVKPDDHGAQRSHRFCSCTTSTDCELSAWRSAHLYGSRASRVTTQGEMVVACAGPEWLISNQDPTKMRAYQMSS